MLAVSGVVLTRFDPGFRLLLAHPGSGIAALRRASDSAWSIDEEPPTGGPSPAGLPRSLRSEKVWGSRTARPSTWRKRERS
jgi:hypothetical protein